MIIKNGPYAVYVLIDKTEGHIYVGTTINELSHRFLKGEGYRNNKRFYAIIKKYGWDNIEQNIFAKHLTEEEAYGIEKTLIAKFRESVPDLICNLDAGGKYGKHCEETKEKIRKLNLSRVISEEAKEKIRAARAVQVFSEETQRKKSEKMRGRKMSPEFCKRLGERSSKSVMCLETGVVYPSATKAAKELNVSVSGISQQIKGVYSSVKGLHFKYV